MQIADRGTLDIFHGNHTPAARRLLPRNRLEKLRHRCGARHRPHEPQRTTQWTSCRDRTNGPSARARIQDLAAILA